MLVGLFADTNIIDEKSNNHAVFVGLVKGSISTQPHIYALLLGVLPYCSADFCLMANKQVTYAKVPDGF
ncbi:MAG: hypothetical protein COA75_04015 [Cellvibrionales bacterium]|nr:MAG: hypothetical protein COA75_04015 [Cellvibrionales bacterium]